MSKAAPAVWQQRLSERLPLYGHRNWIVVADAAYPSQSNPGIETMVTGEDQIAVARHVLDAIMAAKHLRANVYVDRELGFVAEDDAPGVEDYRRELGSALYGVHIFDLPHEEIIHKLDAAARLVQVLILKTEMTIPYTSVFFELDCGYWSAEAEERLRVRLAATAG